MAYQDPRQNVSRALTRFFVRFAMIEGVVLIAIILAMVFDLITADTMVVLLLVVAAIGATVLVLRIRSIQSGQSRSGAGHSAAETGGVSFSDRSGIDSVGDPDPMSKFRDPNA